LDLIDIDEETGVAISWASENPALIGDDGSLNSVTVRAGDILDLKARLILENISDTTEITGAIGSIDSKDGLKDDVAAVLSETVTALNVSADGDALILPGSDISGVR
jgi:hypothetical protein